jgi:hypothetical protein
LTTRGGIRGNGAQLANYLLNSGENDYVAVLDIRGTANPQDLKKSLIEMSLTSELTKSDKGLYHAQINPAIGEDRRMTKEDWLRAAEIMETELGLSLQKRIIVLHEKKNRIHAHVVWERYDHDKGIMISDSYSRLAQDRARKLMEVEFEHQLTPERNKNRPEIKATLTALWKEIPEGKAFIAAAKEKGYVIARGTKRPFMVVDETGRSFDLVRQLDGVRTKEVREKLKGMRLPNGKAAIAQMRERLEKLEKQQDKIKEQAKAEETKTTDQVSEVANETIETGVKGQEKVASPKWSISATFVIGDKEQVQTDNVLKQVKTAEEIQGAKKQEIIEEMKRRRAIAQKFRDNERDMLD